MINRELITEIARGVVKDIGYDQDGFSYHGADVEVLLHGQSPDIAMGVDAKKKKGGEEEGAGDQGMMFGFACTESEVYEKNSFMPAPIYFAHKILKVLSEKRRSGKLFDLQPDAKSQVTVQYVDGKPVGCTKVVVSTQHNAQTRNGKKYTPGMVKDLIGDAVASALPKGWMPKKASDFLVNPTGNFVVGGPDGDCGLTGRKIIVDTYGGYAPHGGGAFSGKDPTKVDRSAAYAARYLAKNVVAAGLAERCTIQIAYAIGVADPMSLLVDTHGTGKVDERKLEKVLPEIFRLTPTNIRRTLKLNRPIYRRTAAYGHFGRAPEKDGGFSWEQTDLAEPAQERVPVDAARDVISELSCPAKAGIRTCRPAAWHALLIARHAGDDASQARTIAAPSSAGARAMRCGRARRRCSIRCCRGLRSICAAPRPPICARCSPTGRRRAPGNRLRRRRASDRARPSDIRAPASSAASRSSTAWPRRWPRSSERKLANIRLHHGDATDLLAWLPAASLARVDLLYPDPWPKRRHWKRRFVQDQSVAAIARIAAAGRRIPLRHRHRRLCRRGRWRG